MKTLPVALTAAVLALLLAGCGTTPTAAPSFGFGDDAVSIARSVKACRAATDQAVPANTTGVTSIATCSINGSQVDFFVDFEFRSRILQAAIGMVFHEAVRRMVNAFEVRARAVYGPPVPAGNALQPEG